MERFAKRKLIIIEGRNSSDQENCMRVFFKGNDGRTFHINDYPKSWPRDMIEKHAKEDYKKLQIMNTTKSKFKVVKCDLNLKESVVDSKGHIKFWSTREEAMKWIEQNEYKGMSFTYVIVEEGEA